jgi:hypothetical protein
MKKQFSSIQNLKLTETAITIEGIIITFSPRQMLHAALLGFIHPVTKEYLKFSSPVSEDKAEKSGNYGSPDAYLFCRIPVTSGIFRDILVIEDLINLKSHRRNQSSHKQAGGNLGVLLLTLSKVISFLHSIVFYLHSITGEFFCSDLFERGSAGQY